MEDAEAAFDGNEAARFDTVVTMKERIRSTFGTIPRCDEGYSDVVDETAEALTA